MAVIRSICTTSGGGTDSGRESAETACRPILNQADRLVRELLEVGANPQSVIDSANNALAEMLQKQTSDVLGKVLHETSNKMKNAYARSDA